MNKIFLALGLLLVTSSISVGKSIDKITTNNVNPIINNIDNKTVYFTSPNCLDSDSQAEVRLLLLDTNYPNETIIKEHVWFENLDSNTEYSYTFDNDPSKYSIMVNGLCKNSY